MIATNDDDVCKRTFVHYAMESDPPFLYSSFQFSRTLLQCNTYSRLHTDARGAKMRFNLGGGNFT